MSRSNEEVISPASRENVRYPSRDRSTIRHPSRDKSTNRYPSRDRSTIRYPSRDKSTNRYPSRDKSKISTDTNKSRNSTIISEDDSYEHYFLEDEEDISQESVNPASKSETIGFYILGLTTYFAYTVLVSSSHDLIKNNFKIQDKPDTVQHDNQLEYKRDCNDLSTGTFLLVIIVPELMAQTLATFSPFFCLHVRMLLVICLLSLGIIICASSITTLALYIGIGFISFSTGLIESTVISYISMFNNKHLVLTLSSGYGSAGLLGSLWYVIFVALGFSSSGIFYSLLFIPVLKAIAFWGILNHSMFFCMKQPVLPPSRTSSVVLFNIRKKKGFFEYLQHTIENFRLNVSYIPHLYPFIISAFLVYFFEYYINQCLHELIYFEKFTLTHSQQYRWYQVTYNIAVFLVKSSLHFITVNSIWWLPILQGINAAFLTLVAVYFLLPHFTLVLCFIFWEGLMGGFTYTTIFCILYSMVDPQRRKFSMAFVSISETVGITCAALVAQPAHKFICSLPEDLSVWDKHSS